MHKCNSTLNTLSSIANQTASLPLAMRFLLVARDHALIYSSKKRPALWHSWNSLKCFTSFFRIHLIKLSITNCVKVSGCKEQTNLVKEGFVFIASLPVGNQ